MPFKVLTKTRSGAQFSRFYLDPAVRIPRYLDQHGNMLLPVSPEFLEELKTNGKYIEDCTYVDYMQQRDVSEPTEQGLLLAGEVLLIREATINPRTLLPVAEAGPPVSYQIVTVGGHWKDSVRLLALASYE